MNKDKLYNDTIKLLNELKNVKPSNFEDIIQQLEEFKYFIKYCYKYDIILDACYMELFYFVNSITDDDGTKFYMLVDDSYIKNQNIIFIDDIITHINKIK